MKRTFIIPLVLASVVNASEIFYASAFKPFYATKDTKPIGKITPTTKLMILKDEGKYLHVRVQGFVDPSRPFLMYFVPDKRIFSLGLNKNANLKKTKIAQVGKSEEVFIDGYVDKQNLSSNLAKLYKKANELFSANCSMCHSLHPVDEYNANQWPSVVKSMANRTPLTKDEVGLVVAYLQKHAKDMKGEKK